MRTKQKARPRVASTSALESLATPIRTSDRPVETPTTVIGSQGIQCERVAALGGRKNDIDGTSYSIPSICDDICNRQTRQDRKQEQKLQDALLQKHVAVKRTHKRPAKEAQQLSQVAPKKQRVASSVGVHGGIRFSESLRTKNCPNSNADSHTACAFAADHRGFIGPMTPPANDKGKNKMYQYTDKDLISDELLSEIENNDISLLHEQYGCSYFNARVSLVPPTLAEGQGSSSSKPSGHVVSTMNQHITHSQVPSTPSVAPRSSSRARPGMPSQVRKAMPEVNRRHRSETRANRTRRARQGPPTTYMHMGQCNQVCRYCNAVFWQHERIARSSARNPEYHRCCNKGQHNKLVQVFRTARDRMSEFDIPDFKINLFGVVGARQYELPSGDSIGAIVFEGGTDVKTDFDVIIQKHGGSPKRINKLHPEYMSLHFPLIFIYGEPGYHLGLTLADTGDETTDAPKKMSMKMFYAYQLHDRRGQYSLITRSGRLFQEYVVTAYCSVEQSRLDYIREKQNDIRNDYMAGLKMEKESSIVSLPRSTGKEIMSEAESVSLSMLKPSDVDKTLKVKAYRKWTVTNQYGKPVLFCCMLIDQQVQSDALL
ncbi:hypothetical protein CTI12_AA163510 [Artemisia annua]|uniref:Helitron helicase-like domain-containing protein n=1 Tax=Artemisia annua TaxID=35608 RepID=A0A2U1PDK8_ARTAN|nr:hypothetical protein CTI12_AA163510 [Artemisia annua]